MIFSFSVLIITFILYIHVFHSCIVLCLLLILSAFLSRIATADFPSPVVSIFYILRHFNLSHVLLHHIRKPPFGLLRFLFPGQLHPQHPSPNIPIVFPPYVSIPPQSCLSCFMY